MSGKLDYTPALSTDLTVDDTGNTFAGVLNGRFKVFIDPYSANIGAASQFAVVGYKGTNAYDAGLFYCPYVPLQMVRAVDPSTFQPKIGFKTRYGMIANPFVVKADGTTDGDSFSIGRPTSPNHLITFPTALPSVLKIKRYPACVLKFSYPNRKSLHFRLTLSHFRGLFYGPYTAQYLYQLHLSCGLLPFTRWIMSPTLLCFLNG